MKRRRFVLATALAAGVVPMRSARSQLPPMRQAAVVIGVDKAGDLPRLRAAASGAC